ncbi:MAG TPA: hypothetical protein GXX29_14960 [Firmicutes bacterium]|nr:hypothetical protein [Bacillota bacterium]
MTQPKDDNHDEIYIKDPADKDRSGPTGQKLAADLPFEKDRDQWEQDKTAPDQDYRQHLCGFSTSATYRRLK